MSILKFKKYALGLSVLALGSAANAAWWENDWKGNSFNNSGTYVEHWTSDGNHSTWNDYLYRGDITRCPWGAGNCVTKHEKSASTMWSIAVAWALKASITSWLDNTVTTTYTYGRTDTVSNSFQLTLRPGQEAQFVSYTPRRFCWSNLRGYAYYTGARKGGWVGGRSGYLDFSYQYEWTNDVAGMASGYIAMRDKPVWSFIII